MAKQRIDVGSAASGITVEYIKRRRAIYLHGHYDHFVGIEGVEIALGDFLRQLGVTLPDCCAALTGPAE